MGAERDELGPGSFLRGTTVAQGPAHSCLQLPFVWMEAVGRRGLGVGGVKVEASVGLHLIRGYEFWGDQGMCCNYNTTQRMCKL